MTTTLLAPAVRPAPSASAHLPAVRAYPLTEPAGLHAWRRSAEGGAAQASISVDQALTVLRGVRAGQSRDEVADAADLTAVQAMDVVAGVGSRIGQANKSGPRAATCLSTSRGARLGFDPGVHVVDGAVTVVLAPGWGRTRKEPRDISRSYSAVVLADPQGDHPSVSRWLSNTSDVADVTYQHMAHLYAVATGTFATLDGITTDPQVRAAYLAAYDVLEAAIRGAQQNLAVVLHADSAPEQVLAAARASFWLLGGFARPIAAAAHAVCGGHPAGHGALVAAVRQLRAAVERSPRTFFPAGLGRLTRSQFRAICAQAGHPVPMDDDGTSDGTGERALLTALAAARRRQLAVAV